MVSSTNFPLPIDFFLTPKWECLKPPIMNKRHGNVKLGIILYNSQFRIVCGCHGIQKTYRILIHIGSGCKVPTLREELLAMWCLLGERESHFLKDVISGNVTTHQWMAVCMCVRTHACICLAKIGLDGFTFLKKDVKLGG